ncbi:Ppx/GppA phosphatase family protein [Microbaculum marinisediminis]|uniref:Ppx/GppA family phosphatase n=1 Tax=Microbaculum marinisediminis TaxID=2931392 RepID=A0AAW5R0B0_9HYPH|nr:Ppx/GppA phosphatase family protein [Microbaculum sp. A6E488]MCT8973239.1 Ppx/GppA family phosphatase [Microbaculum sp. A6E488]
MVSLSSSIPRSRSAARPLTPEAAIALNEAPSRLQYLEPVAVVDVGSNSVRLVVYEGLTRSPTPIFNEKVLCGLGRQVASKGVLDDAAVELALQSLCRFHALSRQIGAASVHVIATAAVREAKNGEAFVSRVEEIFGAPVSVLTGAQEAEFSAHGVIAGIHDPDGIAGDLGGGSLEVVDVKGQTVGNGETLPLGGLRLRDLAGRSMKKAEKIVVDAIDGSEIVTRCKGRAFYAIGGTFRALARLHMAQTGYPLHVMHGYELDAAEALEFVKLVRRVKPASLDSIDAVSSARRELLPYGAMVLEHILRRGEPKCIISSALGVREGLLYTLLDDETRQTDPLLAACAELGYLRSRSPRFARELCYWTDQFMVSSGLEETEEERRLRHAACLLADIGWRSHPDYRGGHSLNIIAYASFAGIDHPGRAYMALAVYYRHSGLSDEHVSPRIRELATARMIDRARILAAALRVAYLISGAMPGVIDKAELAVEHGTVTLHLPGDLAALNGPRVLTRLKQLAKLIGRRAEIVAG